MWPRVISQCTPHSWLPQTGFALPSTWAPTGNPLSSSTGAERDLPGPTKRWSLLFVTVLNLLLPGGWLVPPPHSCDVPSNVSWGACLLPVCTPIYLDLDTVTCPPAPVLYPCLHIYSCTDRYVSVPTLLPIAISIYIPTCTRLYLCVHLRFCVYTYMYTFTHMHFYASLSLPLHQHQTCIYSCILVSVPIPVSIELYLCVLWLLCLHLYYTFIAL